MTRESVWSYPRPPALEATPKRLEVWHAGVCIASTTQGYRVLETSHPPTYYFPPGDVVLDHLRHDARGRSLCEWKGAAAYYDVVVGDTVAAQAAYAYPTPTPGFAAIADYVAFYASRLDRCVVDGVEVTPQPGGFYAGWITPELDGPFKGAPGTLGW